MSIASIGIVPKGIFVRCRRQGAMPVSEEERKMKRVHALLAVAVAAALLAGCGGSGSGSSSGGKPLTVSAWKQKVNSICASVTKQSRAVPTPAAPADLEGYLKKLRSIGLSEIAQLKGVTPPAQFADGQKAVISDLTTIWDKL